MRELYQEMILEHYKKPRNFAKMENPDRSAEGYNPLCGDHIFVYLKMSNGKVDEVQFQGEGCAICTASASLMTAAVKSKSEEEIEELFQKFRDLVMVDVENPPGVDEVGKLAIFAGVREFPARVKCAVLPWHTLHAALSGEGESVSTE